MSHSALEQTSVVLVEPQDDINIGTAVRAAKNFGVTSMRLVRPATADAHIIGVSAPRAQDMIEKMERYDDVDEAVADCVLTLGLTARRRSANWRVLEPRGAAAEIVKASQKGRVAILFGREDSGLPNEVLDRCNAVVTVPTNPGYSSLNLGQAVLLMLWELFRATEADNLETAALTETRVESEFPPAPMAGLERMFDQAEAALEAVEFFKTETHEHIMRSVRNVFLRSAIDTRELAIWHGIFKEVIAYMKRTGRQSPTKQ